MLVVVIIRGVKMLKTVLNPEKFMVSEFENYVEKIFQGLDNSKVINIAFKSVESIKKVINIQKCYKVYWCG